MDALPAKIMIRFTRHNAPYNSGETAGFPRDEALRYISAGVAYPVTPEKPLEICAEIMRHVHAMWRAEMLNHGLTPELIDRCIGHNVGMLQVAKISVPGLAAHLDLLDRQAARAAASDAAEPAETTSTENTGGDDGQGQGGEHDPDSGPDGVQTEQTETPDSGTGGDGTGEQAETPNPDAANTGEQTETGSGSGRRRR